MERRTTRGKRSEQGFTLAALIVILTIMMVFVAYTVPRYWSTVLKREREKQAIFVMRQYARAIYNFQKKNNTYPVSMEQLAKARQPRWLRGNGEGIPDPLTGEMDWLLVPAAAAGQQPGNRPVNQTTGTQSPQPATTLPALPMKDYAGGPFIGVRPPKTGKSLLMLNGADQYEQWTFTAVELKAEIDARAIAAATIYR
jgi:type II secretory pathway pseudopilin PulG